LGNRIGSISVCKASFGVIELYSIDFKPGMDTD